MACDFGWDCGPTLITAGIWQDIGLHMWVRVRLAEVRPQVTVEDGIGRVDVHITLDFACAAYPEEEPFATEVAAEARENVVRLSSHPSLVLWTGNKREPLGYEDWGWKEPLAGRT
jgi:hypothetical protein